MKFRHEIKHCINIEDMHILRPKLSAIMQADRHTFDGKYKIKSLYFDNDENEALFEKLDGVNIREKFRIRLYNGDTSFIVLEKKMKINDLCAKESTAITLSETEKIINGDILWMTTDKRALIAELYSKIKAKGLKPKTVVEYTREPFVFAPGNVRVTLDYDIRTGISATDILSKDFFSVPTGNEIILEVKWDEFLPDIIKDAVALESRRQSAFSKYAQCRIYG